jgi:hypothetical protein
MAYPPAQVSFGADAVRYGSDLSGQNSAYFLQQSSGTAVVPGDLLVKGDLQVDGTSSLQATTCTNLAASNYQGVNSADGFRAIFPQGLGCSNNVTIGGAGGSILLLGDAAVPGGNILGFNGSAAVSPVNFGNGLNSAANVNVTGTVAATSSVTSGNSIVCGSATNPNGQIYAINALGFVPPRFPYGMIGGQNATQYVLSQPVNGTPLQGPAVTWDGSPINIQLGSSVSANAQTFFNIVIPTSFKSLLNSGKVLYFGQIVMGGGAGAGVLINVYDNVVGVATLLNQFGMNPTQTGGAVRGFQGIYEFGNGVYQPFGYISRFSYAGIESQ